MRELTLDARELTDKARLHDALAGAFAFPAGYGRNLDALHDLLTALPPTRLTLLHADALPQALGRYGALALRVLRDAAAENPDFVLQTE